MTSKKEIIKKEIKKTSNDVLILVDKKIEFFKDVIQKTILHVQKNKFLEILGISDVNTCIEHLGELSKKIQELNDIKNTDNLITNLQLINNELSILLKNYGTDNLEDLLLICFGNNYKITTNELEQEKFEILKKYFHPTSYKVLNKKDDLKQKKYNESNNETNLSCYEVSSLYKQFHMKVYGIKLIIYSAVLNKTLTIFGIIDDVIINFLINNFITNKKTNFIQNLPQNNTFNSETFDKFIYSLSLKDFLIYENETDNYIQTHYQAIYSHEFSTKLFLNTNKFLTF